MVVVHEQTALENFQLEKEDFVFTYCKEYCDLVNGNISVQDGANAFDAFHCYITRIIYFQSIVFLLYI